MNRGRKLAAICAAFSSTIAVSILIFVRRRLVVVTVEGPSMEPTYRDGDVLLVRRVGADRLHVGDVVVFAPEHLEHEPVARHVPAMASTQVPAGGPAEASSKRLWLVKRVAALPGDPVPRGVPHGAGGPVPPGRLAVLGDDPERSVDSRQEGLLAANRVRGRVLRRLSTSES